MAMHKKILIASLLVLAACNDDGTGPGDDPVLTLSSDSLSVQVGATTVVTATIQPAGGSAQFTSRDNTVATVDANGAITGLKVGKTVVVGTLAGNSNVRDSLIVAVVAAQTPGQPVQLPLLGTGAVPERFTAEVAASGNVAYTSTWGSRGGVPGNALKIWNVAGNGPVLVDSIILPGVGTISDVQISDNGSLLVLSLENSGSAGNGLAIYDRTNTTRPTLLRRYTSVNTAGGVHTVKLGRINGRLHAFLSVNTPRLVILDLNDPANPVEVFSQTMGDPFIHDVFIRDGILFTALWNTGLRIFDVGGAGRGGSPSNPVVIGTIKTQPCKTCAPGSASVHNVWWFHDPVTGQKKYAFVGEEGPGSVGSQVSRGAIHVVDLGTNFNNLTEVAVYEPDMTTTANQQNAGAHNFVMDEPSGILYSAYYNGGVRALDVRGDLSSCTVAQKTPDGRCDLQLMGREVGIAVSSGPPKYAWGVAMVGSRLYASDMWNGLFVIDISALKR